MADAATMSPENASTEPSGDVHVFFRPELQQPPMDPSSSVGFSRLTGQGEADHYNFVAGINKVPAEQYEWIKNMTYFQALLELDAMRVMPQTEVKTVLTDADVTTDDKVNITRLKMADAIAVVETSFDLDALRRWEASERRIPVKNSLNRRITQLTGGDA